MDCALCRSRIEAHDELSECPHCGVRYHAACFAENGGCGAYGCAGAPAPGPGRIVAPLTAWGTAFKDCPSCGKQIRAAAARCRFCGSRLDLEERNAAAGRRRRSWLLLGLGALPLTAPVALLLGILRLREVRSGRLRLPPDELLRLVLATVLGGTWCLAFASVLVLA